MFLIHGPCSTAGTVHGPFKESPENRKEQRIQNTERLLTTQFKSNTMEEKDQKEQKRSKKRQSAIGIGIAGGCMFGIIFDNLALGLSVGLCLGVLIDNVHK